MLPLYFSESRSG